jgi:EAL domain-containing protein (putative c-di-GMP-specific phosphodiesterase class I)
LVGNGKTNTLLEIKTTSGKLSDGQKKFLDNWKGPRAVVRSVVALAGQLGLTVVAEGAADAPTIARLIEWGVRIAQGDHLGPPVDATVVPGLIYRLGPSPVAGLSVAP